MVDFQEHSLSRCPDGHFSGCGTLCGHRGQPFRRQTPPACMCSDDLTGLSTPMCRNRRRPISKASPPISKINSSPAPKQTLEVFKDTHLKGLDIAKSTVVAGTHYKKILDYVESEKIDLIIMGSGSPLQKAVFGSVADKVAKLSPVPVMLVKSN